MKRLAYLMDSAIPVPLVRRRIGLDSLLGLVPVVGDFATAATSMLIVRQAIRMGVKKRTLLLMFANIGLDTLVGLVPIAGDLFDMAFRANTKNVELLEAEIDGGRVIKSID